MNFLLDLLSKVNKAGSIIILVILGLFVIALVINLLILFRYIRIQKDVGDRRQRKTGVFHSPLLNRIVEDYKNASLGNYSEVNTQAIIENAFNMRLRLLIIGERFLKNSVSLLIILGLMGTFLGLTLSVGELVGILDQTNMEDIINNSSYFINGLISAVGGMAVAFITSLFGIACSIILTLLFVVFNVQESRETLMVHIEEYLDNSVALVVSKDKETEYTMMNRILKNTFEEFGTRIENSLHSAVESFADNLKSVVVEVDLSSKILDSTVEKFDLSLKTFADNIRDFSEFNINLRNNIERMDVNFIKVAEALKDTSGIITDNYDLMSNFSTEIRQAADEMSGYNRQIVKDVETLVEEVKTTVSSIKQLGETLNNEMTARTQDIKLYQERFAELMALLGEQVGTLGDKTADAFSQNLAEHGSNITKTVASEVSVNVKDVMKEVLIMLDSFKDNERQLAKTIASLPDQTIAYSQAAAAKIEKQIDEIKDVFNKNNEEKNGQE
jgi:BMFP domain-containing protein YqiC